MGRTRARLARLEHLRTSEISRMIDSATGRISARYVTRRPCPVCGGKRYTVRFLKEGFDHVTCNHCGMFYLPFIVKHSLLPTVYNSNHHTQLWEWKSRDPESLAYKRQYFARKAALIEQFTSVGRIVDVGCGVGDFLRLMSERGWDPLGLEFNAYARAFVQRQYRIPVQNKSLRDLPAQHFNAVAMSQLIEHIPDPAQLLRDAHRVLKPNGVLFLAFPNRYAISVLLMGKRAPRFKGREHINFFARATITRLLQRNGFHIRVLRSEKIDLYTIIRFLFRKSRSAIPSGTSLDTQVPALNRKRSLRSVFFYRVLMPFCASLAGALGVGEDLVIIAQRR